MVGDKERGTNWIHPNKKNNGLVYNLLSDKLYLSPPEFVPPLLSDTKDSV